MKFSTLILTSLLSAFALATPTPTLQERGCSCRKVGDEYICSGTTCPRDLALQAADELVKRGCSCHKVGDEYICGGTSCP